jgi:hypothetical protein
LGGAWVCDFSFANIKRNGCDRSGLLDLFIKPPDKPFDFGDAALKDQITGAGLIFDCFLRPWPARNQGIFFLKIIFLIYFC